MVAVLFAVFTAMLDLLVIHPRAAAEATVQIVTAVYGAASKSKMMWTLRCARVAEP